ncbi:hypothetical protein KRX51_03420 [Corynebacterium sp. TAE3-ERU12]|uniref:hypothetical protein n=1 Tax=Corynebacterium sp. TAE3-ERU12 TaxID=2849491 RepID=UPI001C4788F7|nr:hypothetical protein [Corynebacterium sp. TAE3-ERU12]MBV7294966.1 hypothetical protein [Corynebacterium sp. TAE3-ERU12]
MSRHWRRIAATTTMVVSLGLLTPVAVAAPTPDAQTPGSAALPGADNLPADIANILDQALADGGVNIDEFTKLLPFLGEGATEAFTQMRAQAPVNQEKLADGSVDKDATASLGDSTEKKDFWTANLVTGCGFADAKISGALSYVQPGPNYGLGPLIGANNLLSPYIPQGHIFVNSVVGSDKLIPVPKDGAGLKAMWVNWSTFTAGIEPMDDYVGALSLIPQNSTLINTGEGLVTISTYGTVAYRDEVECTVLPAVGHVQVQSAKN